MVQIARPTLDVSNTGWTNELGATTNLFQALDETVASDADYIKTAVDPVNKVYVFKIGTVLDPLQHTGHVGTIRIGKGTGQTNQLDITVEIRQGYVNEGVQGTLIATRSYLNVSTTIAPQTITLNSSEMSAITIYSSLYCRIVANTVFPGGAENPWFREFTPLDTVVVTNNTQLSTAISTAAPGDRIQMAAGTYSGNYTCSINGNIPNEIEITCAPGAHVIVNGSFLLTGKYWRIVGLDIRGKGGPNTAAIDLAAEGCCAINNTLEDPTSPVGTSQGIAAFNVGSNQIIYGNQIINRRHSLYTQNDFSLYGYKYIVNNFFLDVGTDGSSNRYHIHGYTEGGLTNGFWIEGNILRAGRCTIGKNQGAETDPVTDYEIHILNNCFHEGAFQNEITLGNNRKTDFVFHDNYMGRCALVTERSRVIDVQNNVFMVDPNLSNYMFRFRTGESDMPVINEDAVWDNNLIYGATFLCAFGANGVFHAAVNSLTSWRSNTLNTGGVAFDVNSTHDTGNPPDEIRQFANEYNTKWIHVAAYNWSGAANKSITVPFSSGSVYNADDIWGAAVQTFATGTFNLLTPSEFNAYIIVED